MTDLNNNMRFGITLIINLIAGIFLAMAGVILTLEFQEIIWEGGIIFRIIISTLWVFGLMITVLKAYTINWSLIRLS